MNTNPMTLYPVEEREIATENTWGDYQAIAVTVMTQEPEPRQQYVLVSNPDKDHRVVVIELDLFAQMVGELTELRRWKREHQ